MLRTGDANQETVESFCRPYVRRTAGLDRCMGWVRSTSLPEQRAAVIDALRRTITNNEHWKAPHRRVLPRIGGPQSYPCVREWTQKVAEARRFLVTLAPTAPAQATLSGCACSSQQDLQGLDDCQSYIHAHKAPTNVGANAHAAGYGPCADGPPPNRASRKRTTALSGLGDSVPQTMGPETARALARALMTSSKVAPDLYNPASALDQVLEGVQPGLSPKVTMRARAMIASGVHPANAVEQALAEELIALAPKYVSPKYPKYPKYPKQPALSGCACHEADGLGDLGTDPPAAPACGTGTAGLICAALQGAGALLTGVDTLARGITSETRLRDQQRFDQRMSEANADRRAVEDAALREAGALAPLAPVGGGIGMGTILVGALGLAAAGGAIYFLTKK